MDNIQEYNISVGKFAKLCGTTRDTLRHYYETGILIPYVDPKNGYHYYSSYQVSSFYIISIFRQAGYTVKEIYELINSASKERLVETANLKLQDFKRELSSIRNKIASLQISLWFLERYDSHKDLKPFIEIIPDISVAKTKIISKNAYRVGGITSDLKKHISLLSSCDNLSIFPTGTTIAINDFMNEQYNYNYVISLSLSAPDNIITHPFESHKILSCYNDHNISINDTYDTIREYIKKNKLKVKRYYLFFPCL